MSPSTLNLVPPAPFPQPLASEDGDDPPVIVDEADLPAGEQGKRDDREVEPLVSHPHGVDAGEAIQDDKSLKVVNLNEDGMIRDSLTLGELRRYVEGAVHKTKKPRQYAFTYSDTESLKKELEEFIAYRDVKSLEDGMRLFEENHPTPWIYQPEADKLDFIRLQLSNLEVADSNVRRSALICLCHLVQGVFGEVVNAEHQLFWLTENVKLLRRCGAFDAVYTLLRSSCSWMDSDEPEDSEGRRKSTLEIKCSSLILYFMIAVEPEDSFREDVASLDPPFIPWLIRILALMRSKDPAEQSQRYPKEFTLLLRKALLFLFGNTGEDLQKVKDHVRTKLGLPPLDKTKSSITANPLDYHLFRQEIIAKYPTYTPPPLPVRETLITDAKLFSPTPEPHTTTTNYYDGSGGPVHIATPAPSPPPSPKLKKSIFQTDQTVPLLLPGNGEVPKSIIEAGELYSQRMRITSATVQMWQEKERFDGYVKGFFVVNDQEEAEGETSGNSWQKREDVILERIEDTYRESLPHLQGMVVTLLQLILANFTPTTLPAFKEDDESKPETSEEIQVVLVDLSREKEILGKAIAGILLLMLKWFHASHVLKFEYLSQLLYDSNYHILLAKILAMENAIVSITQSMEIPGFGLFSFPFRDSAIPPPIARRRPPQPEPSSEDSDEPAPITDFSWRALFTITTFLRILQKVVKRKPYRNLQLVQMKYTQLLRKQYRIPNETVVYYVLKIIKGQVPYSGRKWRQPNMKFITSVYMTIRPELREDWLTTGDIEAEVEDAQPQENALRAMSHYYNVRRYPEEMASTGRGEVEEGEVRWFKNLLQELSLEQVPVSLG